MSLKDAFTSLRPWVSHLDAQDIFLSRSGPRRTDSTPREHSQAKNVLSAKNISRVFLPHKTGFAGTPFGSAKKSANEVREPGFVMPTVIMLMAIMSIVAYAALMQSSNSLNLAYKQTYIQMARTASKAAIDYAQEQFDNAACGVYNGTSEQTLVENSRYRITFKDEVVSTSGDGLEKVIKGTGSVYLPKLSTTAQYVFDVRSEIIRTYATCKTPDNFAPKVWLDASDFSTLKKTASGTSDVSQPIGLGLLDLFLPNDTVEEKVSDGSQGSLSWLSHDIEMHTCDTTEFVGNCTGSTANRALYNGFVFQNVSIPKNAIITSATMQLTGSSGDPGSSATHQIYGLYSTAANPHLDLFSPSGTSQVRSRITNAALHTSSSLTQSSNSLPQGNVLNFNVTPIVQEMVNNANWNSATHGGRIGFGAQRTSGSGSRKICKGNFTIFNTGGCNNKGPKLTVSYSVGTVEQANNTDSISQWLDKSGNGNNAAYAYGTAPTRQDNQINNKTVVRFNNGAMLSNLLSAITSQREMTVFAIMKPNMTTSASSGRMVTGMSSAGTNDTTSGNSLIPLYRNGSSNAFSSQYTGNSTTYRTDYTCGSACNGSPYLFTSVFTINSANNTITSNLKGNGQPVAEKTNLNPTGSPYTFTINQLYYGGRRNGTMGSGTGADYFNGDFAEIVVYDKALECRQIEALEEYFRSKWAIAAAQWATTCPTTPIPTL